MKHVLYNVYYLCSFEKFAIKGTPPHRGFCIFGAQVIGSQTIHPQIKVPKHSIQPPI